MGGEACRNCGNLLPTEAKFCPYCGTSVQAFDGFRWQRAPEDVATCIHLDQIAVQGLISRSKQIQVDAGTRAMILQEGQFIGELGPGVHTLDSLGQRVQQIRSERPTTVVLTDEGDVSLNLEAGPFWSHDQIQIYTTLEWVVRIEDPTLFHSNFFKGRNHLTAQALSQGLLESGVNEVLRHRIAGEDAESLYGDLEVKQHLEQDLRYHLDQTLERNGLRLVQLRSFECQDTLEELREQRQETTKQEKSIGLLMKRLEMADDLDAFQHEIETSQILRDAEKQDLLHTIREKRENHQLARQMVLEKLQTQHRLELDQMRREQEREQDREDMEMGMEALSRMKEMKQGEKDREADREIRKAQELSKVTDEALLAVKDDTEGLRKLAELKAQTGMTEEQILAAAAEHNPRAAKALAEKFRAQGAEQRVEEQKEFRQEMQELLSNAMEQMGRVAESRAESKADNVFVTPGSGGGGDKTTIVQGGGGSSEHGQQRSSQGCPSCGEEVEQGTQFCIACGSQLN